MFQQPLSRQVGATTADCIAVSHAAAAFFSSVLYGKKPRAPKLDWAKSQGISTGVSTEAIYMYIYDVKD